jgi:2-dehydro-3-deoxyphosphooctonate aldolase (KDO 8-P synthase)
MAEILPLRQGELFIIAGPCVIESLELCLEVGRHMAGVCRELGLGYIFKASFDKANRSSAASQRGPGLDEGLRILQRVGRELKLPVLTDVHETQQVGAVAEVVDVLQVPAFLARQTDLLVACGQSGRYVNVKKGQFMSPQEMAHAVAKIRGTGNGRILLTERGTFFGYNRLVNDFTALPVMRELGCPVVFDVTHSTQQPAGLGNASGGNPQFAPMLARAAVAAGVDGLFLECHPEPQRAMSDAATMVDLSTAERIVRQARQIAKLVRGWE